MGMLATIRDRFSPRSIPRGLMPVEDPVWVTDPAKRTAVGGDLAPLLIGQSERTHGLNAPSRFEDYQNIYNGGGSRWVHAAVRAVSQDVAKIQLHPMNRQGEVVERWPHLALDRPNPEDTLAQLINHWVMDLMLTANAFAYLDHSNELIRLQPDELRIYPGTDGYIAGYGVVRGGREAHLEPARVIHWKLPNPSNRYWGTGPSQALRYTLVIQRGEDEYLLNFFKRGARPGGFISFAPEANWDDIERAFEKWKSENEGSENHGKTMMLAGGAKFVPHSATPIDSGYVEFYKIGLQEIVSLYGVTPFRLGILDKANYANAREQERGYHQDTVLPMLRLILGGLNHNRLLVPNPDAVKVGANEAEIMARFRDEEASARAAGQAVRDGILTIGEARHRFYSLGEKPDETDPAPILPYHLLYGVVSKNETRAQLGLPPIAGGDDLPPPFSVGLGAGTLAANPSRRSAARDQVRAIKADKETRTAYSRAVTKRRREQEAGLEDVVQRTVKAIGEDILAMLDSHRGVREKHEIPADLIAALKAWDFSRFEGRIEDEWIPEILRILAEEGKAKAALATGDDIFDVQNRDVLRFISEQGADLVQHVGDGTREAIKNAIQAATENGESIEQLRARLESAPEIGGDPVRARLIAQTETAAAAGFGSQNALEQVADTGVGVMKSWLTIGDTNVRASHRAAEQQGPIPLRDTFANGLRYPGDPRGHISERANERCDLLPEVEA